MREDERRQFEELLKRARDYGYTLMSVEPTEPQFKCGTCGAIVEDLRLHEDWHDEVRGLK